MATKSHSCKSPVRGKRSAIFAAVVAVLILLCLVSSEAMAQTLYISDTSAGAVTAYNAATGVPLESSFITGIGGNGLAISGNNLYVTSANSTAADGGTVAEYNATSGALINANFITGLNSPWAIAISGNNLFVANLEGETVGEYNATTGALINANFIPGIIGPIGLAISGNTLFVVSTGYGDQSEGAVGAYNATTGAVINASLVTGLDNPQGGIAVSGNTLYLSGNNNTVTAYNATTGAALNSFSNDAYSYAGLAISGNALFIASAPGATSIVGEYNATTGATTNANFITGLNLPWAIAVANQSLTNPVIGVQQPAGATLPNVTGAVNFGPELVGAATTLTFTILNTGAVNLTPGAITFGGTDPGDFSVTASPASSVAPSGSTTFTVQFSPKALGNRSATLQIASNDPATPLFTVNLFGSGSQPGAAVQTLYVVSFGSAVGAFNATTGALINGDFINPNLNNTNSNYPLIPSSVVISGNNLFVSSYLYGDSAFSVADTVGIYDSTTGAAINANFITGVGGPVVAVSGDNLYASNGAEYSASTGVVVGTGASGGASAISGNTLYVGNGNGVATYNATTGALIDANFITGVDVGSIAISGNNLYLATTVEPTVNDYVGTVGEYNATTGALINASLITGLNSVEGLAVSGNTLYVGTFNYNTSVGTVGEYNATNGAVINASFITPLGTIEDLAVSNPIPPNPSIVVQQPAGATLSNGTSTVNFPPALIGANKTQTFTIENAGTENLTLSAITFGGTEPGDFSVTASPGSPVTPSGTTTFTVQFAPTALGSRSATLQIASNDPVTPSFTVNLSGIGTLAATSSANAVLSSWATLNGTANPNGVATTAYFEYGTTTAFGSSTSTVNVGSGTSAVPVSFNVAGLAPGKTYYYQLMETNSEGTFPGGVQTFTTPSATSPAQWHSNQLTSNANMASGNRTGAANTSLDQYYYKGTDGNVWCVYWNGAGWAQDALTSNANVSDWLTFEPNYGDVYYQGTDNQIWCVYFDGTEWRQTQLTSNGNVAGDIVVDTVWNVFYYRGTDGNVWEDYWNGTAWTQRALTSRANAASTAAVGGNLSADSTLHYVYYRGTDGNMWVCYFNGTSWMSGQLSTTANVGGAVTADAGGVVYYRSSADNTAWIEYFNGTEWTQKQLNGTTPVASATVLYAQYVMLYVNSSGQAESLYFDGKNWDAVPLGDGASALSTGLSINRTNSWIFCGRNDGNVVIFYYQ